MNTAIASRSRGTPQDSNTVTLVRKGNLLTIEPACPEVLSRMRTMEHVIVNDSPSGCHLRAELRTLHRGTLIEHTGSTARKTASMTMAGLEPVVRSILEQSGRQVVGPEPAPQLPEPLIDNVYSAQNRDGVDDGLLYAVQQHERALVRHGDGIDPAWLIAQIALAYPELSIVVPVARKADAGRMVAGIRRRLSNSVTRVSSGSIPGDARRIVVGTPESLLGGCVDLRRRGLVVALDAVEMLGKRGQQVMIAAANARLLGFLPVGRRLAPRDGDDLRCFFGFEEISIPIHGHHPLPVDVVFEKITGGVDIPGGADPVTVKRSGVWRNPLRNRRIAGVARALRENNRQVLVGFPRTARALKSASKPRMGPRTPRHSLQAREASISRPGRLSYGRKDPRVAVLVANVEQAVSLARRLSDWPIVADPDVYRRGLPRKERDVLDRQRVSDNPGRSAIYTIGAADQIDPRQIDVLVRADAGIGLAPLDEAKLIVPNENDHRLLLLDFDDGRHHEVRRWTRKRRRAYKESGWYSPGADPVEERVKGFLAKRPKA